MVRKTKTPKVDDIHLPEDYSIQKQGITQSMLGSFPICRQRFLFVVNRWRKIDNDLNPLFGNINHDVFDKAYTLGRKPSPKLISKWIDVYCDKAEKELSAFALQYLEQEAALAQIILEEYFNYYESDFEDKVFIEVENVFEIDFQGFKLRGKKDGKFIPANGNNYSSLMEHKNKGRIEEEIIESVLNFDFQNLTYIKADHIEYGWDELKRVLYNIVRKPYKKPSTDLSKFLKRIKSEIKKDPEHFFIRYNVEYTEKQIRKFEIDLYNILYEAQSFLDGELPCYMNRLACKMPYKCEFLDACSSGTMTGYKQQKTWFPEL